MLAQGWKAFHRLSVHLALAVESCDDRGVVLLQLSDAVWRHLELSQLHQALSLRSHSEPEHQDSLTLEWAVRDMEPVFFALLSSLRNRHSLWSRRYTLDGCEAELGKFQGDPVSSEGQRCRTSLSNGGLRKSSPSCVRVACRLGR